MQKTRVSGGSRRSDAPTLERSDVPTITIFARHRRQRGTNTNTWRDELGAMIGKNLRALALLTGRAEAWLLQTCFASRETLEIGRVQSTRLRLGFALLLPEWTDYS